MRQRRLSLRPALTSGVMKSDTNALTSLRRAKAEAGRKEVMRRAGWQLLMAKAVRFAGGHAPHPAGATARGAQEGSGSGRGRWQPLAGCAAAGRTHAVKAEPTTMPTAMSTTLPRSCMGTRHDQRAVHLNGCSSSARGWPVTLRHRVLPAQSSASSCAGWVLPVTTLPKPTHQEVTEACRGPTASGKHS